MASVLLINSNREQMPNPAMPIGLCMVASALEDAGCQVTFCDLTFSRSPERDVVAAIERSRAEVIGVSVRNIDNCNFERPLFFLPEIKRRVIATIRQRVPDVPIVIGGPAVNVSGFELLHFLEADYAVIGEGEVAMPALVAALIAGDDPQVIAGVLARNGLTPVTDTAPAFGNDRVFRHEPVAGRALAADINNSSSRVERWLNLSRYARHGAPYSIQTKRGCALRCSYCVYNSIEGRAYRLRDPQAITDEIARVYRDHGVRKVDFVDSTFNLPVKHTLELCQALAGQRLAKLQLSTMGINPAAVDQQQISAMEAAGFTNVMCTPESASDLTLRSLQKGYGREAVVRAARQLSKSKLATFWFFMFGAPGESRQTVAETLAFCRDEIPPQHMVLFATGIRIYSGTPLEKRLKAQGWFAQDDPLLEPSWYLSPEIELAELYQMLTDAARQHANWMTNAETILDAKAAALLKNMLKLIGLRGPFWQHLPRVFSVLGRLGLREKTLRENLNRIRGIERVTSYRG